MHPYADPSVIMWWVRHPHSVAVEDDTYYAEFAELSDRGKEQIPYLAEEIRRLKPDFIFCSPAVRTVRVILETDLFGLCVVQQDENLREWPRAKNMIGRKNSDPEVAQYLSERLERFMRGRKRVPKGEERLSETWQLLEETSEKLMFLGLSFKKKHQRPPRIVMISHGNRGRQFRAYGKARGDRSKFKREFLSLYEDGGLETAGIMGPFWYGNHFRHKHRAPGWNVELGYTMYLPSHLRESQI